MTSPAIPRVVLLMLAAFLTAACGPVALGESLWERRDPAKAFVFFDTQARNVGDLLTVVIDENTGVQNKENRALSKESQAAKSMDISSSASGDYGDAGGAAAFDFNTESERAFDGAASFRSQREFTTRMTASVVDVLPNGNLVISGRRNVIVAGDERILVISGIVRPYDIAPDNTIASRFIAEFRIAYEGNGQEQAFVRQGFFSRLMNKVWPF